MLKVFWKRNRAGGNPPPLKLGESKGAIALRKRLGKFKAEEPKIIRPYERALEKHLSAFRLDKAALRGKKVLFVGSGCGNLLADARKAQINAFGVEPKPENEFGEAKGKEFVIAKTVQELAITNAFDYVIALWSVSPWLNRAHDKRLSFFRMLSSLKVGGKLCVAPLRFRGPISQVGDVRASLSRKISKSGFKIRSLPYKEGTTKSRAVIIERTKKADLRKLQELLSL